MKKEIFIIAAIVLLGSSMYALTLRGELGNPASQDFKNNLDQSARPFELSPERGRFVHVASLSENGTYALSTDWAEVAYPDVGISKGQYFSFFAPGVAYLVFPFYELGKQYNLGQVAVFSVESLMSLITLIFLFKIGRQIFKLPIFASFFAVLVFAFASTAWSYSITLYQHAFTACFMVTAYYAAWKFVKTDNNYSWLYAAYVWAAYALAIAVDYPNAILLLPIMIYLAANTFKINRVHEGWSFSIRFAAIFTFAAFMIITGFHLWHNSHYFGNWRQLSGGLESYRHPEDLEGVQSALTHSTKNVVGFFTERHVPEGFYVLMFSDERGLLFFSPIFILALAGIALMLIRKKTGFGIPTEYILAITLILTNILLYSSWGDPWGGWGFGPRYLVPAMAWLSLFVGMFISEGKHLLGKKFLALVLFLYSLSIALLGALTTNAIPNKSEGLLLPAKQYNFLMNLDFLHDGKSGSFLYKTYFSEWLTLMGYYWLIYMIIAVVALLTLFLLSRLKHES